MTSPLRMLESGIGLSHGASAQPRQAPPFLSDHELLREIGRGAYGAVWIARSVTGALRAVKLVRRSSFDHDRPFHREFEGIQKFEPISRKHESQVDILHVGRGEDYFYYVMELADDQTTGGQIDPGNYRPRTLKSDLAHRDRLPFEDCLSVGIALATALQHLHENGLVHRDVKPSNVVFVNGVAKLADIGLVTGLDTTRSHVGTEGFAAPEGPGTPQADIYSLGKVLYEISTGKDRHAFPELPTNLREFPDRDGLCELNAVIARACRHDPAARYKTAAEMGQDLETLRSGKSLARLHRLERRLKLAVRVAALISVLSAAGFAAWLWQSAQSAALRNVIAERELLLAREQEARVRAVASEEAAFRERQQALRSERAANTVLEFFQTKIVAAARPVGEAGGLGRDATILNALGVAERSLQDSLQDQPLIEGRIRLALGQTYQRLGMYDTSVGQFERAAILHELALGSNHVQSLAANALLAGQLGLSGKHQERIAILENCLSRAAAREGPMGEQALNFLMQLGIAYRDAGAFEKALASLLLFSQRQEARLGREHPATISALSHLAVTHDRAGQVSKAAPLLEEVLRGRARELGSQNEDTTCSMIDLARVYQKLGRWPEAKTLFQEALATRQALHGSSHYATLIALDSLGAALVMENEHEAALSILREGCQVRLKMLGADHPETVQARWMIAFTIAEWLWVKQSSPESPSADAAFALWREAESLARHALAFRSSASPENAAVFEAKSLLASVLISAVANGAKEPLPAAMLTEAEGLLLDVWQQTGRSDYSRETARSAQIYLTRLYKTWNKINPSLKHAENIDRWQGWLASGEK